MGVDPTIVSLACQIAKLKQWGKAWERTAAAKKEEIVELRTKLSLEVESLREEIAGLRGIVKERDGLLTQAQDQRAEIERLGKQLNGLYLQMEMRRSVDATALAEARREGEERAAEGLQSRVQDMRDEIIRVNEAHGKTQAERDALRAEVAKELNESPPMPTIKRSHPVKVGEWVRRTSEPYGGAGAESERLLNQASAERIRIHGLLSALFRSPPNPQAGTLPMWAVIKELLHVGRTRATELCLEFGCDPDQSVPGVINDGHCLACGVLFCERCEELTHVPDGHSPECEHCEPQLAAPLATNQIGTAVAP